MNATEYNRHQFEFCQFTYKKEKEAYDLAIAEAKLKHEQGIQSGKIFRVSRKICNDAYELFKKNMQTAYPDDQDENLLVLTLMSREKKFFYELPEKVTEILQGPQPELKAENPPDNLPLINSDTHPLPATNLLALPSTNTDQVNNNS